MSNTIVIFGASGDLTSRKLVPALYMLFRKRRLPEATRIVGFSRTKFTHEAWRAKLADTTAEFAGRDFDNDIVEPIRQVAVLSSRRHRPSRRFHRARQIARRIGARCKHHAALLSRHRAAFLRAGHRAAGRRGPGRRIAGRAPHRDRKAVRHRSGDGPALERSRCIACFPSSRCIASTIIWARRRCRMCWCCGSPTRFSSRSGIAITSTTCRSPWPRKSMSAAAAIITTRPA